MSTPDFVDARPVNGCLTHAVRYHPEQFHRPTPVVVTTYVRALCGVGRGGMRVRTNEEGEIQPFMGIDGCDACHVRVKKLRKESA